MDAIATTLAEHITAITLLAASVLLFMSFIASSRFRLWVRDFWATFPAIGSIARLSKDRTHASDGWLRAEETLCGIYKPFARLVGPQEFSQSIEYLRKAADLGRTPTPLAVWALLVVLVIAEGMGFSYLLGTWMAREGSANMHAVLMVAIVFVLCVLLVWITHSAGRQYRRTSLLRSCFKRFKDLGAKEYSADLVSLEDDQAVDQQQPAFKQTLNRVAENSHDTGNYAWVITAIVTIAFIAITSTVMRVKNMEGETIRETAMQSQSTSSNPFAASLPTEVTDSQGQAEKAAQDDATAAKDIEGIAAFVMLGFIFVITQIVGMGAGYKYSFVGRESDAAFKVTRGFATYTEYFRFVQPLRDLANGRLKELQQKLEEKAHTRLSLHKTFDDYLIKSDASSASVASGADEVWIQKRDAKNAAAQRDATWANATLAQATNTTAVAVPAAQPAPASVPAPVVESIATAAPIPAAATPLQPPAAEVTAVQAELMRLDNADAEKAYFLSLPVALKANPQLQAWLKERKAQRDATANIDELF
ncbi:hypothetical protein [Comamonas sp. GB3 AK4-5]|uniref:hypothetical protein n=1 Tax=Comamonas sp. GB3 AK4-5 TaxID=3231487 RepID=UPI00351E7A02